MSPARALDARRAIAHLWVSFDPSSGSIDANATVTLRNDAPSSGLPDYVIANRETSGQPPGTNWMWFNFYSPHELVSLKLDGEPLAVGTKTEFGLNVYQAYLPVLPGGEGRLAGIDASWHAVFTESTARGYGPSAPCREVYLRDETEDQLDWVTELQLPVARA